jgi:hypothetical protein
MFATKTPGNVCVVTDLLAGDAISVTRSSTATRTVENALVMKKDRRIFNVTS